MTGEKCGLEQEVNGIPDVTPLTADRPGTGRQGFLAILQYSFHKAPFKFI